MINDYLTAKKKKYYKYLGSGVLYEKLFDFINTKKQTFSAHKIGHSFVTTAEAGALSY